MGNEMKRVHDSGRNEYGRMRMRMRCMLGVCVKDNGEQKGKMRIASVEENLGGREICEERK